MKVTSIHLRRLMALMCVLCMQAACTDSASAQGTDARPTVETAQGRVRGVAMGDVQAFLGIPYAAAPVGELRWRPPAAPAPWTDALDAADFGPSCPQNLQPGGRPPWTHEYLVHGETSEDCLSVNLWVPANATNAPVLVWFHGGAFVEGAASVPVYNGAALARHGIIVVGVNYRLDALGFLVHPELSLEGGGSSGNYAVHDMIAALRWVQDNIRAFGGDPAQVTISGQSAGASAVHLLIAAPKAKGLFARAIAQSGSGMGLPSLSLQEAERLGAAFMEKTGASTLAELRALPAQTLLATAASIPGLENLRFMPIVDGTLIPRPLHDLPYGSYHDTPILTGLTADEASGMMAGYGQDTPDSLAGRLRALFGERAERFAGFYPAANDAEAGQMQKQVLRERGIAATWLWARDRQRTGGQQPIWLYLFTHPEPGPDAARFGAFHSAELPYLFATLDASPERPFTQADRQLSGTLSSYWVNFVKSGNPNGSGADGATLPAWPMFTIDAPQLMLLQPEPSAQPILTNAKREAFIQHVDAGGRVALF